MSSSAVKATQSKAPNPSVPLANSAWSKGPPQSSATSRAQSPANVPSTPTTQSRRQSTLGSNGPPAVKQAPRGVAAGTGHRPTGSINFGSIEATQAPEKKAEAATPPATTPLPATTPATAPKPPPAAAQPPTNGIKVVAPTPTVASTAPAATTAPTTASTAPAVSATPPGTTPTPSKQKKVNVHALFQGGGMPSVTTTPPTNTPSAPAQPPAATPSAPRGPGSGFNDRNNPVPFPRSPQIGRPTLPGPTSSGGQRPAGSPRMSANMPLQHPHQHQHPMAHPHQHHAGHPGHSMQPPPQWGPGGYYYPPPDYNPYMYWGGHPQHQHPHMSAVHQPHMQPSPRTQPAQPRPPSTPPVPNNASPHPLPPITTSALQAPPSAPSPSLSVNAPTFVPGGLRRPTNPVRISTPNGDALTFEGQIPPSPKVSTPIQTKRASVPVRMETAQQKEERLAKEKEEREKLAKEKEDKERKEKEKAEEEKRAKEEAERKAKEEAERKVKEEEERKLKEEADRKAEEERKAREEAEHKAEEERLAKEKEETERKAKEEAERKVKEEEERKAREEADRLEAERKAKEDADRKAEEELKLKEEADRKAKEDEERKVKEEAEAARAEAEAKAKEEEEKARAAETKAKEETEAKEAAADEARDTVAAPLTSSPKPANGLLPSTVPGRPSPLSVSTTSVNERSKRPVPGPLDLSSAQANRVAAPPSALASARIIEDLNSVPYPETIKTPNPDLNIAATPGKFRYDRDFLLQFMGVCKEKPDSLPPLEAIGLEPGDSSGYSVGPRGSGRRLNSLGMGGGTPTLQRQNSVGLGLGPGLANRGGFAMGNFQSPSNSQSRFDASNAARTSGMPFAGGAAGRLTPMGRSASQGGVGGVNPREAKRTRSQRGRDRGDNVRGSGFQTPANQGLEPVAPLERRDNAWVADSTQRNPKHVEERQLVERKVKALLNKLTMDKFDSISDQIIEWANKSEQEKDGSTLMQVIKLVFEKAKDEAAFSEMYARLCRKMMERVSPNVQDETIRNSEGQPITGGMLFRKYLLNRCQEDFERGWNAKEAALAAAAAKAGEDKAAEVASEGNGEAVLYSEEYYAAAKAKRQGLGLVRFIGELFKLQMLTERIMHECIKKLLSNVVNPEEEEIESLCKLLTTVGQSLDNPKARNHMDIYFERMQDMAKSSNINSRMQFMLLDVIEFRSRNWQSRATLPRPAPAHQDSSRDDSGRHGVSRGGSRRGEARGATTESDGWNVASGANASRPPARAGDLSQFGKISKPTGIQFGPSSVFSKKDANKRDSGSIGRTGGANMFSALSAGGDGPPPMERTPSSRKASVDLGPGGSPASGPGERRKLNLLPRTKPADGDADKEEDKEEDKDEDKDEGKEEAESAAMTEEEAQSKVKEDVKEYLGVENIDEAILALEALPSEHRHLFVDKLVNASMDGGNKVVILAENLFSAARSRSVISPEGFERGMLPTIEMADDLSIDVPKTYEWLARMIHAAGLDKAKTEEMAGKISVYGEPRVPPRELLIKEFEKVSSA